MPPIQPSGGVQTKSITVTTEADNTIVIPEFNAKIFTATLKYTSDFNGDLVIQSKCEDGSFRTVCETVLGGRQLDVGNEVDSVSQGTWVNQSGTSRTIVQPFVLRSQVITKATLGSCIVEIDYL